MKRSTKVMRWVLAVAFLLGGAVGCMEIFYAMGTYWRPRIVASPVEYLDPRSYVRLFVVVVKAAFTTVVPALTVFEIGRVLAVAAVTDLDEEDMTHPSA